MHGCLHFEKECHAEIALLTEQLANEKWYQTLLDMVPPFGQKPEGRDGLAKIRAMAGTLDCRIKDVTVEVLHANCVGGSGWRGCADCWRTTEVAW